MSNTSLSNKPKSARTAKVVSAPKLAASQVRGAELIDPADVARIKSGYRVISAKLAKQGVAHDFDQLAEGTFKLAQVVLSHAVQSLGDMKARAGEAHDFHDAYSSILLSVPPERRQQVLRSMREGLDEITKTELQSESLQNVDSGEGAPVSTRDLMRDLEDLEAAQRTDDTNKGLLVPAAKLAALLKMTPQGLHHAPKAKRIFTLVGPSGEQLYPAFFADPKQDRKMLEKVSKALGDLPGAAKWDFFMSPRMSLGKRTPLEALAKGKFETVMIAANGFAEE